MSNPVEERLRRRLHEAEARVVHVMEVAIEYKEKVKKLKEEVVLLLNAPTTTSGPFVTEGEDTKLLDYMEGLDTGYGSGWLLRISTTGRGYRLHETSFEDSSPSVRAAIRAHMKANNV